METRELPPDKPKPPPDKPKPSLPYELSGKLKLEDLVGTVYKLSKDLLDKPPRYILLQGETLQVNWMDSGLTSGAENSTIRIRFEASPNLPAHIEHATWAPYEPVAPFGRLP